MGLGGLRLVISVFCLDFSVAAHKIIPNPRISSLSVPKHGCKDSPAGHFQDPDEGVARAMDGTGIWRTNQAGKKILLKSRQLEINFIVWTSRLSQ
jgi:hypothetical protein